MPKENVELLMAVPVSHYCTGGGDSMVLLNPQRSKSKLIVWTGFIACGLRGYLRHEGHFAARRAVSGCGRDDRCGCGESRIY